MDGGIAPLTRDRFDDAARALASGFRDDPLFRHLVRDDDMRREWTLNVMRANLRLTAPDGHNYAALDETGRVVGAIGLTPPGKFPYPQTRGLGYLARLLFSISAWRPPVRPQTRAFAYMREWDAMHPPEPHWYVMVVGVDFAEHGRGHGARLMSKASELADREGAILYLETQTEKNLTFYRRFGYETTEERRPDPDGPPTWGMARPARRP